MKFVAVALAILYGCSQVPEHSEDTDGEVIFEKARRSLESESVLKFTLVTETNSFKSLKAQGGQAGSQVGRARVELRPGNRMKIDGRFPVRDLRWPEIPNGADADWMVLDSDGTSMSVTPYGKPVWASVPASETQNQDLLVDFLVIGVHASAVERLKTVAPRQSQPKNSNPRGAKDFTITLLGRENDTLKLEIKPNKGPVSLLWLDSKTYLPLRRETRTKGADWEKTDVELYSDFGTDPFN